MRFGKWKAGYLFLALTLLLVSLGGCGGGGGGGGKDKPASKPSPLAQWNGAWKSIDGFVEDAAMKPLYEALAAKVSGYTAKGVQGAFEDMYHTDFESMVVANNKITFKDDSGKDLGAVVYEAKGTRPTGFEGFDWHLFEALAESGAVNHALHGEHNFDAKKDARYLAMLKVHSDGEGGMKHWHLRYGSEGFDALTNDKTSMWWPTLVAPKTTAAEMAADLLGEVDEMVKMFPAPLAGWEGEWISYHTLVSDVKMISVYEAISAEAKKLGKSYTAADVKKHYQDMFRTDFDLLMVKGNEVAFKRADGTVLARCRYANDGHPADHWTAWKGESGNSPEYKDMAAVVVHGKGVGQHWHLRYGVGKTIDELVAMKGWTPTFANPKVVTPEAFAKKYRDEAAKRAESLPAK